MNGASDTSDDEPWHDEGGDSDASDEVLDRKEDPVQKVSLGRKSQKGKRGKQQVEAEPEEVKPVDSLKKLFLEEALLVVQNLAIVDPETKELLRGEGCYQWTTDLQVLLRNDDRESSARHVATLISSWNVVEKYLIPLVKQSRDDTPFIRAVMKILFFLSKPLDDSISKDAAMVIDPKNESEKHLEMLLERKKHAMTLFDNQRALKADFVDTGFIEVLVDVLQEILGSPFTRTEEDGLTIEVILGVVCNLLAVPDANPANGSVSGGGGLASIAGRSADKSSAQHTHERLIASLHESLFLDVVLQLCEEVESRENKVYNLMLLEICHHLVKGQDVQVIGAAIKKKLMRAAEDASGGVVEGEGADGICGTDDVSERTTKKQHERASSSSSSSSSSSASSSSSHSRSGGGGMSLLQRVQAQRSSASSSVLQRAGSRHTHFGGVLKLAPPALPLASKTAAGSSSSGCGLGGGGSGGVKRVASFAPNAFQAAANAHGSMPKAPLKRDKKKIVFNHSGSGLERNRVGSSLLGGGANNALASFCSEFLEQAYVPLMKSIKNEFRMESARIDNTDRNKAMYFDVTRFFLALRRETRQPPPPPPGDDQGVAPTTTTSGEGEVSAVEAAAASANDAEDKEGEGSSSGQKEEGQEKEREGSFDEKEEEEEEEDEPVASLDSGIVHSSMDLYSFNLVHGAIDTWIAEKKFGLLEHATALVLEMVTLLWWMRSVSRDMDGALRSVGLNLMAKIFFSSDPTDKLPSLLRAWKPATFSRAHLTNLVELGYMTFKMFSVRTVVEGVLNATSKDTIGLLEEAEQFDEGSYLKSIATSHVVDLHRLLLGLYASNSPETNHAAVSFFRRLCTTHVPLDEEDWAFLNESEEEEEEEEEEEVSDVYREEILCGQKPKKKSKRRKKRNKEAPLSRVATFEPLLYNIPFLELCSKVLLDSAVQSTRTRHAFAELRVLCESVVRHFGALASSNPVLYADALFTQPYLQRLKFCRQAPMHYADEWLIGAMRTQQLQPPPKEGAEELAVSTRAATRLFSQTKSQELSSSSSSRERGDEEQEGGGGCGGEGGGGGGARAAMTAAMLALEEEEEEEFGADDEDEFGLATAAPKGSSRVSKRKEGNTKGGGGSSKAPSKRARRNKTTASGGAQRWSAEEDEVLMKLHSLHKGEESMVHLMSEELSEYGEAAWDESKARSKEAVVQRLVALKLVQKNEKIPGYHGEQEEEEEGDEGGGDEAMLPEGHDAETNTEAEKEEEASEEQDDDDVGSSAREAIFGHLDSSPAPLEAAAELDGTTNLGGMSDGDGDDEATPETVPQNVLLEEGDDATAPKMKAKKKKTKAGKRLLKKKAGSFGRQVNTGISLETSDLVDSDGD